MADHIISLEYPAPVNWARWCRNGMVPSAHFFRWCAAIFANVAQHRKKLVFSYTYSFGSVETGEAGTNTRWRFRFRSGYCAHKLEFAMLIALDDHATAADPRCYWDLTEVGVGTTSSDSIRYGQYSGSPSDVPSEWHWASVTMDINPATEYTAVLQTVDYCRPVACIVFERGAPSGLDDTLTGAVDPTKYSIGQPILDADQIQLGKAGRKMWAVNGSQLFAWSAQDTAANAVPSLTGTSYANFFSGTTVDEYTRGFSPQLTYHNTSTETTVPVEFAVYAEGTSTPGGYENGSIKYIDEDSNELEITSISTAGWYTVTGTLPAGQRKGAIMGKVTGASADAVKLYAAHLCEWEGGA